MVKNFPFFEVLCNKIVRSFVIESPFYKIKLIYIKQFDGGALEPKNKVSQVKEKNTGNSARYIIFATGIAIIAVFGVIVYIKKVK